MLTVLSRKFFSQIANGEAFGNNLSDYTGNLVGSVMERIVAETEIQLSVISTSNATDIFTIAGTTITRVSTNWVDEDWHVGDTFNFVDGAVTFTGTITILNDLVLTFTLGTGTATPAAYTASTITLTSNYLAAVVQFGLPENSDTTDNFINVVDGSDQAFTLSGLTTSFQTMNPVAGAKSWITGDCQIKRGALSAGVCTYTIRQEFIILPYYTQDIATNLTDGTLPDDYFKGVLSLKYIVGLQVRKLLSDPNIQHSIVDKNEMGAVGWFGENYNGGVNNYECEVTAYEDTATGDTVTGIQIDRRTTIFANITNTASLFDADTKIGAYLSAILDPLAYAANSTLYKTLWNYDNVVKLNNVTYTGLTGIIKAFDSTRVSANSITLEITVEFSTPQQALLSDGQEFIIALQTANSTLARNVSDSVVMIADISTLTKNNDIPGLLTFDTFEHLNHPMVEADTGFSNFRGWIEDGIFTRANFGLDIAERARLEQLDFKLIAKNSVGREFTIQQYGFDLSSGVLVPEGAYEKQVFNLDTTRGFRLAAGDIFNRVRLGFPSATSYYFHGEETVTAPTTTFGFGGALASTNYATIYLGQYQSGVTGGPTKSITGFTVPTDTTGNVMPWIAVLMGVTIPGITVGSVVLAAGLNVQVTHASIAGAHTIIPCDVGMVGMAFHNMNASKTATTFEVTDTGSGGRLDYIIIEDGVLSDFRSGSGVAVTGGTPTNIPFSNYGTNLYTSIVFCTQKVGKLPTITKNNNSIDVLTDEDDEVNYINILT